MVSKPTFVPRVGDIVRITYHYDDGDHVYIVKLTHVATDYPHLLQLRGDAVREEAYDYHSPSAFVFPQTDHGFLVYDEITLLSRG